MLNWKFLRPSPKKPECVFAQSILTAAFDGQADAVQLAVVAQHRAHCSDCRMLWSDWEKTRAALRSVPVPLVPASLQPEILAMCQSLPDANLSAPQDEYVQKESVPARADLIAYLEAAEEEFSVARLAPFAPEISPPPLLARQILARAPQSEPSRALLWPAVRGFFRAGSTSGLRIPRAVRWGFGLAAPALAAWLVFTAQTSLVQTPLPDSARVLRILPSVKSATSKSAAPEIRGKFATLPSAKKSVPEVADVTADTNAQMSKTPIRKVRAGEGTPLVSPRLAEVSLSSAKASRKIRVVKKIFTKYAPLSPSRATPLVDKTVSMKPKLMRVALRSSAPSARLAAQHQNAGLRISTPVTMDSHAPRLADLRFADADFDETLSVIARQRDNRPEDLGRALDEYSAALLAEHSGENDDEEWG